MSNWRKQHTAAYWIQVRSKPSLPPCLLGLGSEIGRVKGLHRSRPCAASCSFMQLHEASQLMNLLRLFEIFWASVLFFHISLMKSWFSASLSFPFCHGPSALGSIAPGIRHKASLALGASRSTSIPTSLAAWERSKCVCLIDPDCVWCKPWILQSLSLSLISFFFLLHTLRLLGYCKSSLFNILSTSFYFYLLKITAVSHLSHSASSD